MGKHSSPGPQEKRFAAYMDGLAQAAGHADRVMSENSKGLRSTFFLGNDGQMVWPQQYRTWYTIVKPPRTTNSCHCPDPSHCHVRANPLSVRAQRLAANRKKHSIAVNR